ncbi:hypothetical protein Nepgr_026115 [Nepenthes gracilis]|uniref:ETFB lysine methyltransferase n=1 Tax=Nepenthes gracilis TaxID=150966 RepID=A0AAD3T930_NEPGR|nr:hypothetical protein Nepgr_026115 [Nepenthes gracilis]
MSGASLGNFIKHLACTLYAQLPRGSRRMLHQSHFYSSSSSIVFRRPSSPTARFGQQWRPCSLAASVSSKAASQNSSTVSGVPPYSSVLIRCRKDVADVLSEALLSFGASSVSMDEHDDYENSDKVSICSIFTDCEDVDACISHAADSIGLEETPTFEVLKYNPYDWIKRTQESFDPVEVTKGLWIVPVWKTPPDIWATNVILNPGLAFGTGEHATTKLCLLVLHRSIRGGELFLDYGTGSGILSIAALKLGAALSVGVDIDPQAITAAHQNALLNNIEPDKLKLHLVSGNDSPILRDPELQKFVRVGIPADKNAYDVVIANILLNPLLDLADEIVSHAKHGAVVGLSGILSEQVDLVIECYSRFLENITVSEKDDWACVTGTRIRS